jgi:hypothetical protein
MTHSTLKALTERVAELLASKTPGEDLIRMRLHARPGGDNATAVANYQILLALARHIGTQDPMSEANLKGITEKRDEFEAVLKRLFAQE